MWRGRVYLALVAGVAAMGIVWLTVLAKEAGAGPGGQDVLPSSPETAPPSGERPGKLDVEQLKKRLKMWSESVMDTGRAVPETAVGGQKTEGYACYLGAFVVGPTSRTATVIKSQKLGLPPLLQQGPLVFVGDDSNHGTQFEGTVYLMNFDDGDFRYFLLGKNDIPGAEQGTRLRWVVVYDRNKDLLEWARARYGVGKQKP